MSVGRSSSADDTAARHAGFSYEVLVRAYFDCRAAKRNTVAARTFEMHLERDLYALYIDLLAGTYTPGPSKCFIILHPKPREVWAAEFRDRIVHHLVYNHIAAPFHAGFIANSCACIPGRGTLYAATRLESSVRSLTQNHTRPAFYLKCDFANFFVSINKPILRDLLARRIHEPWWLALTEQVLFHDPRSGAKIQSPRKLRGLVPPHKRLMEQPAHLGLPIGNLSSQFFANVYLDRLDQFVKHRLRAAHYVRYVDDFVLLHASPQWLNAARAQIEAFVEHELEIRLNPAKTILQPIDRGIDFVGHVIKPWRRTIRPRPREAALQRMAGIDAADVFTTANSYFGMFSQASHSHRDRARLANAVRRRGHSVNGGLTKTYRRPK